MEAHIMQYFIPSKAYNVLKWVGLILMPALAVFVGAVGPAWGLANVDAIVLTLNSIGALIGALIGVSAATGKPSDTPTDTPAAEASTEQATSTANAEQPAETAQSEANAESSTEQTDATSTEAKA